MRTTWGRRGQAITLTCGVDPPEDSNFALEWRKNDKLIFSAYGREAGHAAPALQGKIARGSGLGLTIHAISGEDAGVYSCAVTKFAKQPTMPLYGTPLRLVVNVAPVIVSPDDGWTEYVKEGDKFHIECKVDGSPPPEISWTKNERIVSASPVLHLANVTLQDQGEYTCLSVNAEGSQKVTIELTFSKEISFDFTPKNKTVTEGLNVFWHCHANSQPNTITYSWTFRDRPIKTTPTGLRTDIHNGDLSLREVRKDDSGWYRCEATNSRGELSETSAFLDVHYLPEQAATHKPVMSIGTRTNGSVLCGVEANPPATSFTWTKNGHLLGTYDKSSYDIFEGKESDGGIYRCTARNEIGEGVGVETHVIVADPPTFALKPPSEVRVKEGLPLDVPCEGFGDPLPIVYWLHNKTRISTSSLAFTAVAHNDHGLYECVVSNSVSSLSSSMNLIVERTRPQPANITSIQCRDPTTLEVQWMPGFDGSHSQTFIVHYRSEQQSGAKTVATSTQSVVLTDLAPFASYHIFVESRNMKGSSLSDTVTKSVCSTLDAPSDVHVSGKAIEWTPVEHARSYRVETRATSRNSFKELGEVLNPHYRFNEEMVKPLEVRIRSLRPPYDPSLPSVSVHMGPPESESPATVAILGGVITFLILLIVGICWRWRSKKNSKRKRRQSTPAEYGVKTGTSSSQPHTETIYEPSLNIVAHLMDSSDSDISERIDDGDYSEWTGVLDNGHGTRQFEDILGMEYETPDDQSAIGDMLRNKYIYGVEDVPPQLINDLRIEKLRREYKQSQL